MANVCPRSGGQWALNGANRFCHAKPAVTVGYDNAGLQRLKVGSNKTLIGLGPHAGIQGMGLFIGGGAHNVIVRNLTLSDINPQVVWGGDALTIDNAEGVWIDHNTFARIGRQMIVTGRGSASHVTISNNEFDGHPPYSATCDGHHYWVWLFLGHHDTLTVSRNYIHDTSGRAPHAGGMGNADVVAQLVNNVFVYFTYQGAMKERSPMILRLLLSILAGILLSGVNLAAAQGTRFGVSRAGDDLVVNTGANLIFSVDGRNGDLVSMRFHGSELQSPEPKASQIASGLGKAKVELKNLGDVIVVSAQTGDLVHYYIAKEGRDAIYMATYAPPCCRSENSGL